MSLTTVSWSAQYWASRRLDKLLSGTSKWSEILLSETAKLRENFKSWYPPFKNRFICWCFFKLGQTCVNSCIMSFVMSPFPDVATLTTVNLCPVTHLHTRVTLDKYMKTQCTKNYFYWTNKQEWSQNYCKITSNFTAIFSFVAKTRLSWFFLTVS